jgi:outer membrane receptor protein involved in Fe transport
MTLKAFAPASTARAILAVGVAAGALMTASGASAAAAQAQATNTDATVQEVIVTAQKREQRLQDVPVAVTVLNGAQLQQAGVHTVKDLTLLTPGLNATTNGNESTTTVRIRGIGTVADNPGLEDAVGIYIDGVYRPRNGVGFNNLGELSDVEVLKGPQGTLFGKNTVAGVVQITTARPSFNFGAQVEGTVQNYNGWNIAASITGPLVADKLAARLYFSKTSRDGYVPVISTSGQPQPNQYDDHVYTMRGQLLYTPVQNFDVNFIADYTNRNDHCCAAVGFQDGFPAVLQNEVFPGTIIEPVTKDNTTAILNSSDTEKVKDWGLSAQANWTTPWFGGAKLVSITAYRDWRDLTIGDSDYTGADLVDNPGTVQEFKQFSQELRYSGDSGPLSWQVGAFYSHETLDVLAPLNWGTDLGTYLNVLTNGLISLYKNPPSGAFPAGFGTIDTYHQAEHSFSVYTQDDYHITDRLTLTGGVRFTSEHKSLGTLYNITDNSGTCTFFQSILGAATPKLLCLANPAFKGLDTQQAFTENTVTGTAKVSYKLTETAMVYASYSRGNLVGGFNLAEVTTNNNTSNTPETNTFFPAENVDAFEVGTKLQFFHHRLLVTSELFYQKYSNFQLNAYTGTEFIEETIPDARSEGVELDAYWRMTPDFTVNAGVTYADTVYPNSTANQEALGNNDPSSPLYQKTDLFRLPGSHVSFGDEWSLVGGATYSHPILNGLKVTGTIDVKYQSPYNTGSDHDPVKTQPAFALADGRIGIGSADGRWAMEFWATNLFNQHYGQAAFDGVVQTFSAPQPSSNPTLNNYDYFPGQPRFWGMTVRVKY